MRVATANIRNLPDMPRPFVREDASAAGAVADLVGLQEIGEEEDHQDVADALGEDWALHLGGLSVRACDNPIAYRLDAWEWTGKGGHLKLHDGVRKVSVDRNLVWGDFRRVDRPHVVVRHANAHFVANVWGPGDDQRPDHELRRRLWEQDWARMDLFARQCLAGGVPLVCTLDANRGDRFVPFAGGRVAYGPGIDKITVHDAGGVTFDVRQSGTVRAGIHSDHAVRWSRIRIQAPKPAPPVPHACPLEDCGLVHLPPED